MAQIDLKKCTIKIKDGSATPKEIEIKVGEGNLTYSEKKTIEYVLDRGKLDGVREGDEVPVDVSFAFVWEYIKGISKSSSTGILVDNALGHDIGDSVITVGTVAIVPRKGSRVSFGASTTIYTIKSATSTTLTLTTPLTASVADDAAVTFYGTPTIEEALKGTGEAAILGWVSVDDDACRPYAVDIEVIYEPTPSTCGDKETISLPDFRQESLDHDLRAGIISCSGKCNTTQATTVREAQ